MLYIRNYIRTIIILGILMLNVTGLAFADAGDSLFKNEKLTYCQCRLKIDPFAR